MTGEWTVKGEKPNGETVEHTFETRSAADCRKNKAEKDGLLSNLEIIPPNQSQKTVADGSGEVVAETGDDPTEIDLSDPKEDEPHPIDQGAEDDPLGELGEELGTDPLSILPGHMTDDIQGQLAVNKRGYAMIAERYGISASANIEVYPWDNDEGRCVAKAVANTGDGKEYTGWATANADDGDMEDQIIELAETRALKRSVSWASGVGIVSYQELSSQLEG